MRILTDCSFLEKDQLERIQNRYDADYVCESQLKLRSDEWSDFSAAIFYTEVAHPDGSHWFGIWKNGERYMISNAISAVNEPFFGVVAENHDVIYSRFPNDYRLSDDKSVFIDGGRAHPRYDMEHNIVTLKINKGKVIIFNEKNKRICCDVPFTEELESGIV